MSNENNTTETRRLTDEELNTQIGELQEKIKLFKLLATVVIGLGILLCVLGSVVLGVIVTIGGAVLGVVQAGYQNKLKSLVAGNIVKQALEDVFDEITYEMNGQLPESYVRNSNMGIPSYDKMEGSDYVKGTYKGLNIEMSDVTLISESVTTDEDGNEQRSETNVFQGLWLVCDFGKALSADMRLWERGKLGKMLAVGGIKTENDQFNKHFYIQSEIEHEAFYILTPHMMEYILEMDKKAGGETHMCFDRNGKVQIAIHSGRDAFEVGKGEVDAVKLREKFVQEIRYVTDIIDQLRLVDTLFR